MLLTKIKARFFSNCPNAINVTCAVGKFELIVPLRLIEHISQDEFGCYVVTTNKSHLKKKFYILESYMSIKQQLHIN